MNLDDFEVDGSDTNTGKPAPGKAPKGAPPPMPKS